MTRAVPEFTTADELARHIVRPEAQYNLIVVDGALPELTKLARVALDRLLDYGRSTLAVFPLSQRDNPNQVQLALDPVVEALGFVRGLYHITQCGGQHPLLVWYGGYLKAVALGGVGGLARTQEWVRTCEAIGCLHVLVEYKPGRTLTEYDKWAEHALRSVYRRQTILECAVLRV